MIAEWASIYIICDDSITLFEKAWTWHEVPVPNHLMETESEFAPWDLSKAHILVSTPVKFEISCSNGGCVGRVSIWLSSLLRDAFWTRKTIHALFDFGHKIWICTLRSCTEQMIFQICQRKTLSQGPFNAILAEVAGGKQGVGQGGY